VSPEQVQVILADFANRATCVGTRLDGAEVWRFDVDDKSYELHYWIDDNTAIKKYLGGAKAAREFSQLQAFQKLGIPAPRVIANLKGFRIGERKGDACIVVHDPSVRPLRDALVSTTLGRRDRIALAAQFIERLESLYREKLCPIPLTIDRFALKGEQIVIADGAGEFNGIITDDRLRELDRSTHLATRATERLRFWKHFRQTTPPKRSRRDGIELVSDAIGGEGAFARIALEEWAGVFMRKLALAVPWLGLGDAAIDVADWTSALPALLQESSEAEVKNDHSGSVRSASITLGGVAVEVIVKRPAFRAGLRGAFDRLRQSRARRTWYKNWRMLGLGFPCEVPLLLLENRSGLLMKDQLIVFARVPGPTMAAIDLDALRETERSRLLYACGRLLRQIDSLHIQHADAKNTNWIAWTDASGRAKPILIDLDGIRFYPYPGHGYARFVRAMKTHPQIRDEDLRAIDQGFRNRCS
jgi:hypothetical protein